MREQTQVMDDDEDRFRFHITPVMRVHHETGSISRDSRP